MYKKNSSKMVEFLRHKMYFLFSFISRNPSVYTSHQILLSFEIKQRMTSTSNFTIYNLIRLTLQAAACTMIHYNITQNTLYFVIKLIIQYDNYNGAKSS